MNDPLSALLLAMGFASLLMPFDTHALPLLGAGLVGMHRVLAKREPLYLIAGVFAIWILNQFWDLVPMKDSYTFTNEHETLHAAPAFVGGIVWVVLLVAIVVLARARVGMGLMVLSLASLAMSVLAKGPLLVTDKASSATVLFGAIEGGWGLLARRLVAMCFLAMAFEPKTTRLEKRGLVIVGIVGTALFAATYEGMPLRLGGGQDGVYALCFASMALAWILSAIGYAGFARAGGRVAGWVAMAFSVVQLLMLVVAGVLTDRYDRLLHESVATVMTFGLLAIGIAAVSAPALGIRVARGVAGILALTAVFGTTVTLAQIILSGPLGVRHPFGLLPNFVFPFAGAAIAAWAACLAYLVAPPSAKVAA